MLLEVLHRVPQDILYIKQKENALKALIVAGVLRETAIVRLYHYPALKALYGLRDVVRWSAGDSSC